MQHASEIATVAKTITYSTSVGLMVGSTMDFMNENVGVVGGIGMFATWVLTWVYKQKDNRRKDIEMKARLKSFRNE